MLEIDVSLEESYNEATEKFVTSKEFRVTLEHSLVSLSKWESLWEEPFLGKNEKTADQTISYVQMMVVGPELPQEVFQKLLTNHLEEIQAYIAAKMTATRISEIKGAAGRRETITAELIYYWMISMNIPAEYQHWHLNRLITLIRVISVKNTPPKKMSMAERRSLNRQRLMQNRTRG